MIVNLVSVDCCDIHDWNSFHNVFKQAFGFPDFYGRNMDAWIDCMTSLDAPEHGMSEVHCSQGGVLTLEMKSVREFRERCTEQYAAIIECSAFVNYRRIEIGESPVIALSFRT